jgi:PKD repeat protein
MKKIFTVALLLIILGTVAQAQTNLDKQKNVQSFLDSRTQAGFIPYNFATTNNKLTTTCIDTLLYPHSKTTALELDTLYFGYVEGVSQAYYLTSNGFVHGIKAFVMLDTNTTAGDVPDLSMIIKVSDVDPLKRPLTTIDSTFVTVSDIGYQEQTFMFTNPVPVSTDFAVSIELDPAVPLRGAWYITNSSVNADGNDEQLAATLFAGIWYNFQAQFLPPYDIDNLVAPIFAQDITAGFTASLDSMCLNNLDTVIFTDTSTINMADTMINFNSVKSTVYQWDYDDGTGVYNHMDTSYLFSMPGQYDVQLLLTNYGYTGTCVDSMIHTITVYDTSVANFGFIPQGFGDFQFTDSSTAATNWSWTFQSGTPTTSSIQNPMSNFTTSGNYEVCLTVSDTNGCNVNTFCDSVTFVVGIENLDATDNISIYPIPAINYFNVIVPNNYFGGKISLTNVVGQELKSVAIENQEKVRVSTKDVAPGVYFVSLDYQGERIFTKKIVVDR